MIRVWHRKDPGMYSQKKASLFILGIADQELMGRSRKSNVIAGYCEDLCRAGNALGVQR